MTEQFLKFPQPIITARPFDEYCKLFGYDPNSGEGLLGKRILDVGIGYATFARVANSRFKNTDIIGFDIMLDLTHIKHYPSPDTIEFDLMRKRRISFINPPASSVYKPSELEHPQAELVQGTIHMLPFSSGTFDDVISSNLIGYFGKERETIIEILSEMVRVCRKGGRVMFSPDGHKRDVMYNLVNDIGKLTSSMVTNYRIPETQTTVLMKN